MLAIEFLKQSKVEPAPFIVVGGPVRFFKLQAIARLLAATFLNEEPDPHRISGKEADWTEIHDELSTLSMWGGKRFVLVEEADEFVTKYRSQLEKYAEKPATNSILLLECKTWLKTTRLAKQLATSGLVVECTELKPAELLKFLQEHAPRAHQIKLPRESAQLLIELVGNDIGLLDQELSKLASYTSGRGPTPTIEVADVSALVGGWTTETTWAMADAVRDGQLGKAYACLDQLLVSGEPAPKLLGGIAFVFRKYATATLYASAQGLRQALIDAKVFPTALGPSEAYLRRIGRNKALRISEILTEAESGLKGGSPLPDRMQLERLLAQLAGQLD
jgi:DNA polymerase III subunit delta